MVNKDKFEAVLNDLKNKLTVERIMVSKEKFRYYSPEGENKFDIMPIMENNEVVKYWDKKSNKTIEIKSEHIISSNLDLISLINCFQEKPFYFVKHGTKIMGLVSIPDLNKSPMRVLLYLLISEIELSLKEVLSKRIEDPLSYLSEERKEKINGDKEKDTKSNLDLDIYEYLYLCDYFKVLDKEEKLIEKVGLSKNKFNDQFGFINTFRNDIAHPTRDLMAKSNPNEFIKKLKDRIERLIEFNDLIKTAGGT